MPHVVLEYTKRIAAVIDVQQALFKVNDVLIASGQFNEKDITSRALPLDVTAVGTSRDVEFAHLTISMFKGRPLEICEEISSNLLHILKEIIGSKNVSAQLSVEIADIDRNTYKKETIGTHD